MDIITLSMLTRLQSLVLREGVTNNNIDKIDGLWQLALQRHRQTRACKAYMEKIDDSWAADTAVLNMHDPRLPANLRRQAE